MKTLRVLYHLVRADFLERVRRYGFLLMLLLVTWLGYLSVSGDFHMRMVPDYIGVINSAWVGGTMTVTVGFTLGLLGFYIVKGSISRDYETGVGQIMATTPLKRPLYMIGKWFSNFAVLGITVLIMLCEGIAMQFLLGVQGFNMVALAKPLIIIALPCMGMIAAFAVLFESIPWLRGGLGNVLYFFFFLLLMNFNMGRTGLPDATTNPYMDFTGWQIVGNSVAHAARMVYPNLASGFSFQYKPDWSSANSFLWNGVEWTNNVYLSRLFFIAVAVGLAMVSSLFFDRFNPSHLLPVKRQKKGTETASVETVPALQSASRPAVRLTPIADTQRSFRFKELFIAELKLFLKGQPWWWYAIAGGLIVAQLFTPLDTTRILLLVAWVWPIFLLSSFGCRESRYDTRQIVFSAPRPIANQLPARWLSAFVVIALLGFGALVRFIIAGESFSILGWLTGITFIPSLALLLGTLTGSSKAFEALYILWMYALMQKVPSLDFAGLSSASPLYIYAPLAIGLFAVALFIRQRQLKNR